MYLLAALACSEKNEPIVYISESVEAFTLEDVNENSLLFGEPVATTDYTDHISLWYFGHAT